jgi:hypothetical protein
MLPFDEQITEPEIGAHAAKAHFVRIPDLRSRCHAAQGMNDSTVEAAPRRCLIRRTAAMGRVPTSTLRTKQRDFWRSRLSRTVPW